MLSLHPNQVSCVDASVFSSFQPRRLQPGCCLQRLLPGSRSPPVCCSSWLSLRTITLPALHIIWKLKLGQRLGLLRLFISLIRILNIFVPTRFLFSGPQVFFPSTAASTTIRFPATCQYVVPAIHPGGQPGQACVLPAIDDGSGPCLLSHPFFWTFGPFLLRYASSRCVYTIFEKVTMTRTAIDFSFGVGAVCFLWRFKTRPVRTILRSWTLELSGYYV